MEQWWSCNVRQSRRTRPIEAPAFFSCIQHKVSLNPDLGDHTMKTVFACVAIISSASLPAWAYSHCPPPADGVCVSRGRIPNYLCEGGPYTTKESCLTAEMAPYCKWVPHSDSEASSFDITIEVIQNSAPTSFRECGTDTEDWMSSRECRWNADTHCKKGAKAISMLVTSEEPGTTCPIDSDGNIQPGCQFNPTYYRTCARFVCN